MLAKNDILNTSHEDLPSPTNNKISTPSLKMGQAEDEIVKAATGGNEI
jgi:hypothetical protein